MSTNLEPYIWPTNFACTLVTDKIVLPNQYVVSIAIEPTAPPEIATGFRRMRTFIDNFIHNSIFIFQEHELVEAFKTSDTNKVYFPTDPYDYFVGCVLLRKFQMITQDYFEIGLMTIDSALGDHVQYCIRDPEEAGLELSGDHWWNRDSLDTGDNVNISWSDLDLSNDPKFKPRIIKGGRNDS
jgi:hypothetical protein